VFTHAELLDATVSRRGLAIPQNVSRIAQMGPERVSPRMGGTTVSRTVVRWSVAAIKTTSHGFSARPMACHDALSKLRRCAPTRLGAGSKTASVSDRRTFLAIKNCGGVGCLRALRTCLMWQRNEGRGLHRTASGRGDRVDPAALRPVAFLHTEAATRRGWIAPQPGFRLSGQPEASSGQVGELTYVDVDTSLATF
jgi:hypothetical protein